MLEGLLKLYYNLISIYNQQPIAFSLYLKSKFHLSIMNFKLLQKLYMLIKFLPRNITIIFTQQYLIVNKKPYYKNKNKLPENRTALSTAVSLEKSKSMAVYESQPDLDLAKSLKTLQLKDFSIKVHSLLLEKQRSPIFWSTVQQQFLTRIEPTTNPITIRSYSKILYSLSKSKQAKGNYETKISLLLPFSTPQSFTTMVTSLSRIAPFSQEFGYIVQKQYYKRKSDFRARQIISINYSLANNGRKCDSEMIKYLDHLNAVQTVTMLRAYDKSDLINKQILKKVFIKLKSIKREWNVLDLSDILSIYLKYEYITPQFQQMVEESYNMLKRHVNDICLQKIWAFLPQSVNKGFLKIKFVEDIITTLEILRKGKNMSEVIWKKLHPTFQEFENIQLRVRLQKIY